MSEFLRIVCGKCGLKGPIRMGSMAQLQAEGDDYTHRLTPCFVREVAQPDGTTKKIQETDFNKIDLVALTQAEFMAEELERQLQEGDLSGLRALGDAAAWQMESDKARMWPAR